MMGDIETYIAKKKHGKGFITLDDLHAILGTHEQERVYAAVRPLLESGKIVPLKNARSNGSARMPLYEKYRIVPPPIPRHDLMRLHPLLLSTGYLERNPAPCHKWWPELLELSVWLQDEHRNRDATLRERCWEVFGNEKAYDPKAGLRTCVARASGQDLKDLLLVLDDSPEELSYATNPQVLRPRHIVVSENRDPYLAMRRGLLAGKTTLFGTPVDAVVFGSGDAVRQADGASLRFTLESMHAESDSSVTYWGDIDREGITILVSVCAMHGGVPFASAYEAMLATTQQHPPRVSPDTRGIQMPSIEGLFCESMGKRVQQIIENNQLLPQEVVSFRMIQEAMA